MTTIVHEDGTLEIGETLPHLPLRDVVVFPHMIVPLLVGRPASVAALQEAMAGDRLVFVTAQRSPDVTEPLVEDIYRMGAVAKILQLLRLPDGTLKVLIRGVVRARLSRLVRGGELARAKIQVLDDVETGTPEVEALQRSVANHFSEYVHLNKRIPDEVLMSVVGIENPSVLSDTMAAHVIGKVAVKQRILESVDLASRFRLLGHVLGEELEIVKIERKIEGEIKSQVKKNQKEYYLNEQLKAIRKELGYQDAGGSEIDELRAAVDKARMPKEASEQAHKEIDRLSKMAPLSPEAAVVRTYVEMLAAMPWRRGTRDRLDLTRVQAQLDADHYGLEKVKERILEFLAVVKLTRSFRGPILCFVGPPGVGKTSLGRSIAEAMGRRFVRVSLGGVHDEAEIRGHRRTYIGAMPGRIVQSLRKCGSNNPVFLLDEIDKLGHDFRGDPASALLEALDPEQNSAFSDHYLEVPFDLSKAFFITTANVLHTIPAPLLDRMEVIQIPGYLDHEKTAIAERFLLPKQMQQTGIDASRIEVTPAALETVIHRYTREAGVRNLERELGRLCRKVARSIAETAPATGARRRRNGKNAASNAVSPVRIDRDDLTKYLSVPPFTAREVPEIEEVGVATGLAWTSTGGEILPIEVTLMGGKGNLIITGQLGDVMKESARAALSYVRSIAQRLGVKEEIFDRSDLHIHVPEGAIPKDGPSAGLAMATAIASAVTGQPIDRQLAMTGEITLRGKALAIGGLNEKAVAAVRAGVKMMIVPHENQKDLPDLPAHVREALEIVPVHGMDEVLSLALRRPPRSRPRSRGSSASQRAPVGYAH
jgi:ATP-dependent Lon protease